MDLMDVLHILEHILLDTLKNQPCVSDSMSESAAVFGGLANMKDGLRNCNALYKPEMIAVSTTCMAEVIGDDLNAFIIGAREEAEGELDNVLIPCAYSFICWFSYYRL